MLINKNSKRLIELSQLFESQSQSPQNYCNSGTKKNFFLHGVITCICFHTDNWIIQRNLYYSHK